jgi:hypothetical protein
MMSRSEKNRCTVATVQGFGAETVCIKGLPLFQSGTAGADRIII